ncbi:MAG: putative cation:proton antiport protein [Methanomassiliicoccales archaeon PtaU1.Bin124]|nr:MAG: putative cation:proton antiport protein [Methanomassiliicoccales archaeon PtaU1.Bin124]
METNTIVFEIGVVMLVSFIGAALATKARQSVIIGYIFAGILIGPYISFEVFGLQYSGIVKDTGFIDSLSTLGLTLLMFFVGLEFSFTKLKRTKSPAVLLALINTGLDMFIGILIGYALGWPIVDTVFLAGVFAMGSAAITGKSLLEMQRMSAPETEFLLGAVIVEDFVSMVIMTIAGGLIFKTGASDAMGMTEIVVGVLAFYAFFIFLALVAIPRCIKYLESIKNEELFILFALGMVFLSAALAQVAGVPAIIGAFFLGMVFAETKLSERFEKRVSPFKDAFVAMFFVSFGMLINPGMFGTVLPIILIAVPLVIVSDLILTGVLTYLLGFSSRGSTFIGASMCGRGAESVMFASIGSNSVGVTKAAIINPFAGLFCFILSVVTPGLMRASDVLARSFSRMIPASAKFGGALVNRTFGKVMLPSSLKLFKQTGRMEGALIGYFVLFVALMVTSGLLQMALFFLAVSVTIGLYRLTEKEMRNIVKTCNYDNLGVVTRDPRHISRFIAGFIFATLLVIILVTYAFTITWWFSLPVLGGYLIAVLAMMRHVHSTTRTPLTNLKPLSQPKERSEKAQRSKRLKSPKNHHDAFGSLRSAPVTEVSLPEMSEDGPEAATASVEEVAEEEDEVGDEKDRWGRL